MDILTSTSADYNRWANDKLDSYDNNINNIMVEIKNPLKLSKSEKKECVRVIKNQNMVLELCVLSIWRFWLYYCYTSWRESSIRIA